MHRVLGSLAVLLCASATAQQPSPAREPASPEFDWYDTIDHPKLAGLEFVKLTIGWATKIRTDERTPMHAYGYVALRTEATLRIITTDLAVHEVPLAATDPAHRLPPPQPLTARQLADECRSDQDNFEGPYSNFGPPHLTPMARSFVLAHTCHANGDDALARELLTLAKEQRPARSASLQAALAQELGHVAWWRIILAFNDPTVSLAQLAARTERLLDDFPALVHGEGARATLDQLRVMIAAASARKLAADPTELPTKQRIAEYVFRLREQNGFQWGQPGSCDVFSDPRGNASPAHRLLEEGLAAAPALAAAFDDRSFSRSVGYHRDFYFSHRVLRVGDVAQRVLHRMTGQWFEDRAAAERFAQTLEDGGEIAACVQSVIDRGSAGAAARLLELAPRLLLTAVTRLLEGPLSDEQQAGALAVVGGVDEADAVKLLQSALRDRGPWVRLAAATALALRDGPERARGVAALGELWTDLSDELDGQPRLVSLGWKFDLQDRVGRVLALFGGEAAMQALASRPKTIAHDTLIGLGSDRIWLTAWRPGEHLNGYAPPSICDRSPIAERAREQLLGSLLGDRTVLIGGYNGVRNPRRCDFAAASLAARWPQNYFFDLEANTGERNRLLVEVRARWQLRRQ